MRWREEGKEGSDGRVWYPICGRKEGKREGGKEGGRGGGSE